MARYLVTGIAGFIGSSLARALLTSGHEVRGVDNLSCSDLSNLSDILSDIDFCQMDINETDRLCDFMHGVDFVLHEAALASVPRSINDPMSSHTANATGTLSVLMAAQAAGVSRIVYAASSSAYGDQEAHPKHESMCPAPLSPYAVQKLAGENYVKSFWAVHGLEGVCLRYFNVFGPGQAADSPYSGVIARFITDMLAGEQSTIFGDGLQSRDFTYVANVVSANLLACKAPREVVAGEVFNIGTGRSQTLNALYATLARILDFRASPAYKEMRAGDVFQSQADISRARSAFGYSPTHTFEQGLEETVSWYIQKTLKVAPKHFEQMAISR
jgi:UDP-glucose 4-epimerase